MSRRRTAEAPAHEATAGEIVQQVADSTHIPEGHTNGHANGHVSALDKLKAHSTPKRNEHAAADPFFFESISLTEKNDGPKLRLGRSNRHKEMLIRFDQKPGEDEVGKAVFAALKDKGFHWNSKAQAWTLPIDPLEKFRAHQAAEQLFKDIGNTLREANGLPPVTALGHSPA